MTKENEVCTCFHGVGETAFHRTSWALFMVLETWAAYKSLCESDSDRRRRPGRVVVS